MRIMNTPKSVDIDITNRCNLRCAYCSHFESAGDVEADLPTEEWLAFFEELGRCAVMTVCICGGEPFLRDDLQALIQGIVRNRMRFSILSNGTLITPETADFIARTGRCDSIQVSIDAASPSGHDACRGRGNFSRAVQGLEAVRRAGIPATVRVTIHRHNVSGLEDTARFLLDEIKLPSFSTNAASHFGLCRGNREAVQLGVEEQMQAMASLRDLANRYDGRISAAAGPLADYRMWVRMEEAAQAGEAVQGGGLLTSCGGVFSKLAVRADGVIVPCTLLSHIELGRINRDGLAGLWQGHPELARMRNRRKIPLTEYAYCRDCRYVSVCRGGCPAQAYTMEGDENRPVVSSCYRRFLEGGGVMPP